MVRKNTVLLIVIIIILLVIASLGIALLIRQKEISKAPIRPEDLRNLLGGITIRTVNWQDPDNPISSPPLEENEIPKEAIRIGVSREGFSPSSFEVEKGEKVVLAVTSEDEQTHIFKFRDPLLTEVAVGVSPGRTRAIIFYAPSEPGEYDFFCRIPGHEIRGEKGKMVVK